VAVDLPARPQCQSHAIKLLDFRLKQKPPFGGPVKRVERLGSRYAIGFTLPAMHMEPDGGYWIADMTRALAEGARWPVPLDGFRVGIPGTPTVAATTAANALTVPVAGGAPNYAWRKRQWINLVKGGRRYLHQIAAQAVADNSGNAVLSLTLPTRVALAAGDALIVSRPTIEGDLVDLPEFESDVSSWLAMPRFTIAEDE
jgi:hypothetical protein